MLEDHLAQAERHVAQGEQHVVRQRQLVAKFERRGHAAAAMQAKSLLARFEELLAIYIADRDRLVKDFAAAGTAP